MSSSPIYVAIDVACATGKRLPIRFVRPGGPLKPLTRPGHLGAAISRVWATGRPRPRIHTGEGAHNVAAALNGLARKAAGGPAARGETEIMDDVVEPRRPAHPWGKHVTLKTFGEDASAAKDDVAVEAADLDHEAIRAPYNRQVRQTPATSAVDPLGSDPATGTGARLGRGTHRDQRCDPVHHHVVHDEAIWHQIGSAETIARGLGSLGNPEPDAGRFRKKWARTLYARGFTMKPLPFGGEQNAYILLPPELLRGARSEHRGTPRHAQRHQHCRRDHQRQAGQG